jgi:hypothetical protein
MCALFKLQVDPESERPPSIPAHVSSGDGQPFRVASVRMAIAERRKNQGSEMARPKSPDPGLRICDISLLRSLKESDRSH